MTQRPAPWMAVKLEELVSSSKTGLVRSAAQQGKDKAFPYIKMNNVDQHGKFNHDSIVFIDATPDEANENQLEDGDFIFNTRNSTELVGKCGIYRKPANLKKSQILYNNNLLKIKFYSIDTRIVPYWLRSPLGQAQLNSIKSSTTSVAAIYQRDLMQVEIPCPPLNEQIRIAQKLDELLAQVDNLKARIDAIPALLKRFRQSALAAAVSGRLTEEWRIAQGESVATTVISVQNQFTMPPTWICLTHDEIANVIDPHPSHRTPSEEPNGVPYIGIGDVDKFGKIDFENARKVSRSILDEHKDRYSINEGDFIYGKIGTIGSATRVPSNGEYTISANVILVKPISGKVDPTYHWLFWRSPLAVEISAKDSKATSQAAFGIKKMRKIQLTYPPLAEQTEIVRRVEQLFAFADQLEAKVASAKTRIDHLTQSILAKAFRGELVPQDPNDEPASVLLERIKAQRAASPKAKRSRKASA